MNKVPEIVAIIMALLFAVPAISLGGQSKITEVYDGTTVKAEGYDINCLPWKDIVMEVRLAGIATPHIPAKAETREDVYRQRAREYLAGLLLDKVAQINGYDTDSENRVVAEVCLNDRNINLEMLRAGFAEVYHEELYRDLDLEPYRRAETEARKAGRGMWALDER